ncbi:hypothetical protein DSC_13710 [Pseudoxanthomonas spadix BD-a59]|jgi:hypothetical protein|uniref:Uncharacterized protein n=1 Tax=Pseudoxanthomonas spadix (strain BD-a59) TaxID=1045855 RepID=G7UTE0_PSEUP|nr:hypothetical protein DSC_13710 [Pseudoxanthomonas spadix BD-a59]
MTARAGSTTFSASQSPSVRLVARPAISDSKQGHPQ